VTTVTRSIELDVEGSGKRLRLSSPFAAFAAFVFFSAPFAGHEFRTSLGSARPVSAAPRPVTGGRWWRLPAGLVAWQWELDHPLSLTSDLDLGLGDRTPSGHPAEEPVIYDIDGFDNPARTVAGLHARGDRVICYIEVGAAETYRPDYAQLRATGLGRVVPGYPDERYLNINLPAVVDLIERRILMCARRGFDAVEPDIDDSYTDPTGFDISEQANIGYDITLSRYAHSLRLGFGLKNGDEDRFAARMLPHVDFVLDEQCIQYDTCRAFEPAYRRADIGVLEAEYVDDGGPSPATYCARADALGLSAVQYRTSLDASSRVPCQ